MISGREHGGGRSVRATRLDTLVAVRNMTAEVVAVAVVVVVVVVVVVAVVATIVGFGGVRRQLVKLSRRHREVAQKGVSCGGRHWRGGVGCGGGRGIGCNKLVSVCSAAHLDVLRNRWEGHEISDTVLALLAAARVVAGFHAAPHLRRLLRRVL